MDKVKRGHLGVCLCKLESVTSWVRGDPLVLKLGFLSKSNNLYGCKLQSVQLVD